LEKIGNIFDVFSLGQFVEDPTPGNMPVPFANVLGMEVTDQYNYDRQLIDDALEKNLNAAKFGGKAVVQALLDQIPEYGRMGYDMLEINSQMASDIIQGKYKRIQDVENDANSIALSSKTVSILFKRVKREGIGDYVTIIKTFFLQNSK
jgi:hypothetical protein